MRDLAAQVIAGNFQPDEMNDIITELENIIRGSGQTLSGGDLNQIQKAVSTYAAGGTYYTDSGGADAYVLSVIGTKLAPHAYFVGMLVQFRTSNANTGASTINVSSLGVKNIKLADGTTDPSAADISANYDVTLIYNGTSFLVVNQSLFQAKKIIAENILCPVLYIKNYFDNGGMQIYQRAAAHTLVKDVYGFSPDRWAGMATGTLVTAGTITQATASTLNDTGLAFKFAGVTATGTGILYARQRISSQDAIKLKGKSVSMQFQVNQDTGGAIDYTIYIEKADALNDFTTTTSIANSGSLSVSSAVDTEIKLENTALGDCSNGLEIEIKIECGAITTKNFEISNAKLEIGEVITNFVDEDYNTELEKCRMYYELVVVGSTSKAAITYSGADVSFGGGCIYNIQKVKIPTLAEDFTNGVIQYGGGAGGQTGGVFTGFAMQNLLNTINGFQWFLTGSGTSAYLEAFVAFEVKVDAEL